MNLKLVMRLLQISLGVIFFWYGILKVFDGVSPAQELATMTISMLTFNLIEPVISIKLIAIWELLIGLGFITGYCLRTTFLLFFVHMFGTFTPLVLLPEITFTHAPYAFTIVGQYIVKNVVFVLAGMGIYYFNKENNSEKISN